MTEIPGWLSTEIRTNFELLGYLPVGEAQFLQLKKLFDPAHVNCFSCHILYLLFPWQRYVIRQMCGRLYSGKD